jgi:hypothetical protein
MTKQDPTCICFEEFLNQKPFESNFQFSVAEKSFPIFIFFSVLARQYSFSCLSSSSHSLSHIFFTGPVSSSVQPHIRPIDPISFGHLRLPDARRRLWPPRPLRCSSLCHPPPAPWSRLAFSPSSPSKTVAPHRLLFPVSISRNQHH